MLVGCFTKERWITIIGYSQILSFGGIKLVITSLNDVVTCRTFNIEMLQLFIICPFPSELLELRDCSTEKLKLHSPARNLLLERISSSFGGNCRNLRSLLLLNMKLLLLIKILFSGPAVKNGSEQICHSDTERWKFARYESQLPVKFCVA